MSTFNNANFRVMFAQFEKYQFHLKEIATAFLLNLDSAERCLDSLVERDSLGLLQSDCFGQIRDELKRLAKIMRFLACLFITSDEDRQKLSIAGLSDLSPASDVVWLAGFAASGERSTLYSLERSFSEIISKSQEWTSLCDEVMRTAVTSVKARPARDRVVSSLKKYLEGTLELTSSRLEEINTEAAQVITGMRKADTTEMCTLMAKVVGNRAQMLLEGKVKADEVCSRWVKGLFNALRTLKVVAGAHDMALQLEKWMTEHSKQMALSDLLEMTQSRSCQGMADLGEVQALMVRVQGVKIPEDREDLRNSAARLLIMAMVALNMEAGWVCVSQVVVVQNISYIYILIYSILILY